MHYPVGHGGGLRLRQGALERVALQLLDPRLRRVRRAIDDLMGK